MPDKDLVIPGHLEIAIEAANRLNSGEWSTNEVLIAALADLESFVRLAPDGSPIIDAGPLEDTPIFKMVVNGCEKITNATGTQGTHGSVAVMQLGILAAAIKGLEVQVQQLNRRITELEQR
ncbi:hypothetical protein [Mycobacterium intracellulare]|uniref:hypothetical protein n=1 Tax=Mycobacterium intracellulare TaxID=1767 RepID=UPI0034D520A4